MDRKGIEQRVEQLAAKLTQKQKLNVLDLPLAALGKECPFGFWLVIKRFNLCEKLCGTVFDVSEKQNPEESVCPCTRVIFSEESLKSPTIRKQIVEGGASLSRCIYQNDYTQADIKHAFNFLRALLRREENVHKTTS